MAVNRRKNGSYSAQYYVGGERFTVPGSFENKAKARRAIEQAKSSHEFRPRPEKPGEKLLFGAAAAQMLQEIRVEPNTRVSYESTLSRHVLPALADVPVEDITRRMLKRLFRRWENEGKSKYVVRQAKAVISNTLQMLTEDDRLPANPARGIDLGQAPRPSIKIENKDVIRQVLVGMPTEGARLWMFVRIATGCRINEIRGLRPRDLVNSELDISSVVNENKSRKKRGLPQFTRRPYTKNRDTRKISVPHQLAATWAQYVQKCGLGPDDPLFTQQRVVPPLKPRAEFIKIPTDLGTVESASGRSYPHGTVGAYVTAKCRCDWCRIAVRQDRRKDKSYTKGHTKWRNPDEYVTEAQWRTIWTRAWSAQGITDERPTAYQMRHTHASWLIDGGQVPAKVMQRLGHHDLAVTQRYVRPVNDDRELSDAIDALNTWLEDDDGRTTPDVVVDVRDPQNPDVHNNEPAEHQTELKGSDDQSGSQAEREHE